MNNRCVQFFSLLIISSFAFSLYGMENNPHIIKDNFISDFIGVCKMVYGGVTYDGPTSFPDTPRPVDMSKFPTIHWTDDIKNNSSTTESSSNVQQIAGVVASIVLPTVTTIVIKGAVNGVNRYTFKRPQMIVNSHNGELEIEIVEKSEIEQKE